MNKSFLSLLFLLPVSLQAQVNTLSSWKWIAGDSTLNATGRYGTKGVANAAHEPQGRAAGITWKDAAGNFWLFGGEGVNITTLTADKLADLWKYDPLTRMWTWMGGDSTVGAVVSYGTKGLAAAANTPGARSRSASWLDRNGDLWLFGGKSYGTGNSSRNDLWKYNPAGNEWTWVSGDTLVNVRPVYGVRGISAPANMPGSRNNASCWIDGAGKFWLFGGNGYASNGGSWKLNDLWKYDPDANEWTWMGGDTVLSRPGVYGTRSVPAPANRPGAREAAACWTDAQGAFWLFGGSGQTTSATTGMLNDLWKYNPSFQQWTWMGGDTIPDQRPVYGAQGIESPAGKPGGRQGSPSWADAAGNLWFYGGIGLAASGPNGRNGDCWKYNPASDQWTWVRGDSSVNQTGIYGTKGTAGATDRPESRTNPMAWTDNTGNMWLFGGFVSNGSTGGYKNDLWQLASMTPQAVSGVKNGAAILYPNPVAGKEALHVVLPRTDAVAWLVTDAAGKVILPAHTLHPAGSVLSLDISSLPAGRYYLLLQGAGYKEQQAFIKL